jgi:hypothetical protein
MPLTLDRSRQPTLETPVAEAEAADIDRWAEHWAGSPEAAYDDVGSVVRALARLAAQATPPQSLYVWLSQG